MNKYYINYIETGQSTGIAEMKKLTIKEIKADAKTHGVEIKKANRLLNGKECWETSSGFLMNRKMLENCYHNSDYSGK